jgi:hypothetical protein
LSTAVFEHLPQVYENLVILEVLRGRLNAFDPGKVHVDIPGNGSGLPSTTPPCRDAASPKAAGDQNFIES